MFKRHSPPALERPSLALQGTHWVAVLAGTTSPSGSLSFPESYCQTQPLIFISPKPLLDSWMNPSEEAPVLVSSPGLTRLRAHRERILQPQRRGWFRVRAAAATTEAMGVLQARPGMKVSTRFRRVTDTLLSQSGVFETTVLEHSCPTVQGWSRGRSSDSRRCGTMSSLPCAPQGGPVSLRVYVLNLDVTSERGQKLTIGSGAAFLTGHIKVPHGKLSPPALARGCGSQRRGSRAQETCPQPVSRGEFGSGHTSGLPVWLDFAHLRLLLRPTLCFLLAAEGAAPPPRPVTWGWTGARLLR